MKHRSGIEKEMEFIQAKSGNRHPRGKGPIPWNIAMIIIKATITVPGC